MKIDYNHLITFVLIFMIIQYIFLCIELKYYLNMISDIQGYRFNLYKNEKNEFTLKNIIVISFIYLLLSFIFYHYLITIKKSYIESFFIVSVLYSSWDLGLFCMFDKSVYYYKVLLFDIFIVGGFSIVLTKYLLDNFYDILKKYIPLLFIFYLLTMIMFYYENYKYNPDLSNIKGVVIF